MKWTNKDEKSISCHIFHENISFHSIAFSVIKQIHTKYPLIDASSMLIPFCSYWILGNRMISRIEKEL